MNHHFISANTKVYIRAKEGFPATTMMACAYEGFSKLGAEIATFESSEEIERMDDLGPETMIMGYIGDVWCGLEKMNKPLPEPIDYPDSLKGYLFRRVERTTVGTIRRSSRRLFIKPVDHKRFTGFIWEGGEDPLSRRRIVHLEDSAEIYASEPLNMISEYRAIILEGEILDVRRYHGDWSIAPDPEVITSAVSDFENSGEAPVAYTLDFAVVETAEGKRTVLVEANDGFAFSNYGLEPVAYASCLAARWQELTGARSL